jgi:hypothetical protein
MYYLIISIDIYQVDELRQVKSNHSETFAPCKNLTMETHSIQIESGGTNGVYLGREKKR